MTSAGSRWIRFAVAATKTRPCFSCIQVRNVEKMRPSEASPCPASRPPVIAISISSIQRSAGERDSTVRSARSNVCSGLSVPKTRFMSRRKSGRFQSAEIALTESDLPQPDIPIMRMPFGNRHSGVERFLREEGLALDEPFLEVLEPADVGEGEARRHELEDAVLPRRLLLLREDLEVPGVVEDLAPREHLGDDVLRLVRGQALERHRELLRVGLGEALLPEEALAEVAEEDEDLGLVRQVVVEDVDLLAEVVGDDEPGRHEDEEPAPPLERAGTRPGAGG